MNLPCAFSQDSSDPDDSIRCWKSVIRRHLREKLTGQNRYSAALKLPGMLHGQVRRGPHPHAGQRLQSNPGGQLGEAGHRGVTRPLPAVAFLDCQLSPGAHPRPIAPAALYSSCASPIFQLS